MPNCVHSMCTFFKGCTLNAHISLILYSILYIHHTLFFFLNVHNMVCLMYIYFKINYIFFLIQCTLFFNKCTQFCTFNIHNFQIIYIIIYIYLTHFSNNVLNFVNSTFNFFFFLNVHNSIHSTYTIFK